VTTDDTPPTEPPAAPAPRAHEHLRQWPLTAEGKVDTRAAMTVLGRSFPSLDQADGIAPWRPDRFLAWLAGPAPSLSGLHAGRFLLAVWNGRTEWAAGAARELGIVGTEPFDLFEAASVWDAEHRLACATWLEAPFRS
jgi:hypothetical protein